MSFLHLGVATAVLNEAGEVLLSKRGDMDVWNLPTGRLDKSEFLMDAAAREVREETGIECEIIRPVGLYFQAGRGRMNILFVGRYTEGQLLQKTDESNANQFFAPNQLPTNVFGDFMVKDALKGGNHLFVLETPTPVLRRVQRQLAWRYIKNLASGKPEPRWAKFEVQASLAIVDSNTQAILSLPYGNGERILPGVVVNGETAMWEQIKLHIRHQYEVYELKQTSLRWVGLFQNKTRNALEFIFTTEIVPQSSISTHTVEWTPADSGKWWHGYKPFIEHIAVSRPEVKIIQEM